MFKKVKYYIIVADNGFVIKNEINQSENIIEFPAYIPNVPFYLHLFDENNNEIKNITNHIKNLKMKNVSVIMPDDTLDIYVDKKIFLDYFYTFGAKKVEVNYQCLLLTQYGNHYISFSKTARNMAIQYIKGGKSLAQKYYDKDFKDIEQIRKDMQRLHIDCEYGNQTVYINNVNNNMDLFENIGNLVTRSDIFNNAMNNLPEL
ncbi:hypothetical protein [Anaerocolumna xylanovorans]|nr:hypothetical protein [Anaerocolumna xylanovorans]